MIQTCALGDVVDVSAGQPAPKPNEFADEGIPFIRAGSLDHLLNGGTEADCEKVPENTAKALRLRLYPKDTVLFAKSGMSATLGRVYRLKRPSYVVSHLAALVPKGAYDPAYLTYWLRRYSPSHLIKDPAYPSIRIPDIEQMQVPKLPMSEQRRISAVLDKTDGIHRKREQVADRVSGAFVQSINFGLTAQGRVDELPPVFRGAPESTDLRHRARLHPTAFEGPAAGDRSGGLDALRGNRKRLDGLLGEAGQTVENRWFEPGAESQIAVIRWIKTKLEKPGISRAYLADPFLGSEALQRVIARQGNEKITLTILVSPRGINPDADTVDEKDSGDHLGKLVATANEWSDRLCGQISIIHIRRGDGAKQAFHDRYLSVVDQQGVPAVYLLSNSLSKAAGDWPFAICELDRVTSWQVHHYILRLIEGNHSDRDLRPETIWQSGEPASAPAIALPDVSQQPPAGETPNWVKSANSFLHDLWNVVVPNAAYRDSVADTVKAFITGWPQGIDTKVFAETVFRSVGYREEIIVFVSSLFAAGAAEQRDVAGKLDDMLLAKFLSNLPREGHKAAGYLPMRRDRKDYLRHIGRTIAKRPSSTNYVRAELNPVLHALVQLIESQRFDFGLSGEAVETGICLVSVGLEVAIASEAAKEEFRLGIAADYIHWIGRLTRSDTAHSRFDVEEHLPELWRDDLSFAAQQVLAARNILGEKLDGTIRQVLDDPLVLSGFKNLLTGNAN
jgi:Type I restriction modification DNA specificity domain